jgi:autotransporter-associated beta strand protein
MQTKNILKTTCLCAGLLASSFATTQAQTITNNDSGFALNLGTEWFGGTVPGAANVAVWNNLDQTNTIETLGANLSWAGIQILDPGTNITISAGNTLTLGASGIDMSLATNGLTLACPIVLGANQTWNVTNGLTLNVSGAPGVSTATSLTKAGNGILNFSSTADGTYTGNVSVNGGVLIPGGANVNGNSAIGTGVITNNNGGTIRSANKIVGNALVFNGTSVIDANLSSFALDGDWSGSGTVIITNGISAKVLKLNF